ncbi:39772_t:CDS:2, partial [Gigaspora margarita]
NSSFTSELTIPEQEAISEKIAKLKKKISELEDIFIAKEGSKRNKVHTLENKLSNNKTSNIEMSKVKKDNNAEKGLLKPLKQSQQQFSDDTKFSSDDPKQESMRLIVAKDFITCVLLLNIVICLFLKLTSSKLNISKIPETQDTTVPINNRIKAHKPNSNSKRTKKETHADHNAFIDTDKSDTNLLKKYIGLALNVGEMLKTQDTTFSTNNRTRVHKPSAKKGKQNDYNAPINVDEIDPNDTKKKKQVNHNAPIDLALNVGEILKTQDTTAPTNNRTRAHKPKNRKHINHNASINIDESDLDNNRIRATKGTRINHNSPIDVNESDTNLSEKNIELALNVGEILETQYTTSLTNNRTKGCKSKKEKNLESSKKLDKDLQSK